eukprot:COSAG02_NODE_4924_length_4834_cov_2.675818_2_plen_911_part_00
MWLFQDIMEVALNGLAKHVREVKDTSAEHTVKLEEHAEAIAELGGSVSTKGGDAKASLTVGNLEEIRGQLSELLAFRSAQEQEMTELQRRAVEAEAEAELRRAVDADAEAAAADGVPDLATLAQQVEELRLQLAEQKQLNAEQAAQLQEIMQPRDGAEVPPWINYDASAKPTSAKPSSRDGMSRGGSSRGSRAGSRPGRSGGGLGIGDGIEGIAVGDPSALLQGPDGPLYEGDRPFSVAGATESMVGTSGGAKVDASQVGPSFNTLSADTAANTRAIEELMNLKDGIEKAVAGAASATSQSAAVAMQGASIKAQLMAIATEMHGQKERIVALEGGGKGPTLTDTQQTLADLSAKSEENFAQLQILQLDVARLQGKQERARTPWGTNAVVAPGTPLAQVLPTVSKAETGLAAAMASGDPVAVAAAQADLAKTRASASEAEVAETEMALKKAAAEKAEAEAAVQAAIASGDSAAVAAAEAQLSKSIQQAKVAEHAQAAAQAQADLERTTMAHTQAAMEREIQSRGGTAATRASRSSRGGGGDGLGATEHLRTGELALLKLDSHQQDIEDRMVAEEEARVAAIAHCEESLRKLGDDVNGMRGNLQDACETLREKAERFDVHKLEVSVMEAMDLIHMIAGRGAGASQAEAAVEMHKAERARMEEMIAEHGDQLQALFSASASKEDVDAAANLVAEMDRKLAAEMEAKAAGLMKQLEEAQASVQSNLSELGESVAAKADAEWSKAMEAKIRADVAASTDSEEMKNRRLKRQLKTLQEKLSLMAGASMRESGTWRSYHAIFNRCLACNNPLSTSDSSWQTANVVNTGLSGAPGFASPADGLGLQSASHTQNRTASPKRAGSTSSRIPMKEDHAEVIMKGGFPMSNPKAKQRAKLDRAKAKAGSVSGLSLSGMGGST